ncbi:RagB/SusD family nutrient uptake outer membrane protein [Sphingobacterium sp. HJSM2_6]|uniref:RagB/SusD family nutrient uptake outer membrane protein n=1 Tax=Sphingobacterium sp. HJSM2_6 TaxID=3366264 RepID=UPI003BD452E4
MKMKLIKLFFLIFAIVICSCKDTLDKSPDGRIDLEDIFSDSDRVGALLNSCYGYLPGKSLYYQGWTNYPTATSDESWSYAAEEALSNYYNNAVTDVNHPFLNGSMANMQRYWSNYFAQIRLCTQFLAGIDNALVVEPALRRRWKAEVYVLRAFYLSELLKWYGGVPLNNLDLYALDHDYSKAVRNTPWEVAEAIEADCREAIKASNTDFPFRNQFVANQTSHTAGEELRVNKALAWALMSKMYLFAASDLHSNGVAKEERIQRWKKAYDVNKEAIIALEGNGFALFTTHTRSIYNSFGKAAAFHQINSSYDAPGVDKETIWQNNSNPIRSWDLNGPPGISPNAAMYTAYWPTQELVDAFEVVEYNGNNIVKAEPLLDLANPYVNGQSGHLRPNLNPAAVAIGYNDSNPYAAQRDPRLYATVLRNGDKVSWYGENDFEIESRVGGKHEIVFGGSSYKNTKTGYYARKFWTPGASDRNQTKDPAWKYFRLAELKLNFAETATEYALAKGGDLTLQNEAAGQINQIRARVGMPGLSSAVVNDENSLRLYLRNERKVELAFEECRFFDVRRWSKPEGDLSATDMYLSGMEVIKDDSDNLTFKRIHINKKNSGPTRNGGWQNKYLFLPISREDVTLMQNQTGQNWQNPGWN